MKTETINTQEKVLFRLSLQVIGIKRRCRKAERHFFHLGHIPYNDGIYDVEALKEKAKSFIDTNMKEIHSQVRLGLDHVVIKNEGTYTVTQWEPFSDLNKKIDFNF